MVSCGHTTAPQISASSRTTETAVTSVWRRPRRRWSCPLASPTSDGLSNHSSPQTRSWSAPMTKAPGAPALTRRALRAASARAVSVPPGSSARMASLTALSSTRAGCTEKETPTARSIAARAAAWEASTRRRSPTSPREDWPPSVVAMNSLPVPARPRDATEYTLPAPGQPFSPKARGGRAAAGSRPRSLRSSGRSRR